MHLSEVRKKFPDAAVVAGSVIAVIDGKHYNLGKYIGDDSMVASADCLRLIGEGGEISAETKAAVAAQAEFDHDAPQIPPSSRPKGKKE